MGNACKPFGYSIDDGMKAFCVSEMFIAFFHLVVASEAYSVFKGLNNTDNKPFWLGLIMIFSIILMITLIGQFVMAFLLYFIAYKQRNMTICLVWIIVGCINFGVSLIILLSVLIASDFKHTAPFWTPCYLYLLYMILGVWIVVVYMKWAKSTGVAVQYSVTPASGNAPAKSQSHRSAKVANEDYEA